MTNFSFSDVAPYVFYLVVAILGGIGVKLGIVTTSDVAYALGGIGIGHGGATTLVGKVANAIAANTSAVQANTVVTSANTAEVTRPQPKEGV